MDSSLAGTYYHLGVSFKIQANL